jgi:hypothetical protein
MRQVHTKTTPKAKKQPNEKDKRASTELGNEELKNVTGGLTPRKAGDKPYEFFDPFKTIAIGGLRKSVDEI